MKHNEEMEMALPIACLYLIFVNFFLKSKYARATEAA